MPADTIVNAIATSSRGIKRAAEACRRGESVAIAGAYPGARPALVSALWRLLGGQLIVWTASPETADRFAGDCSYYCGETCAHSLAARDDMPGSLPNPTDRSERLEVLAKLSAGDPGIYCVSHAAARQPVAPAGQFARSRFALRVGREYDWETLLGRFDGLGYRRGEIVSAAGEFAVRGGIIDVFPATAQLPVRLEFDGGRLESARVFDLSDQRSVADVQVVDVVTWSDEPETSQRDSVFDYALFDAPVLVDDPDLIAAADASLAPAAGPTQLPADESGGPAPLTLDELRARLSARRLITFSSDGLDIPADPAPAYGGSIERFIEDVRRRAAAGQTVVIVTVAHRRVREVLNEHDLAGAKSISVDGGAIDTGYVINLHGRADSDVAAGLVPAVGLAPTDSTLVVLGDAELFGQPPRRHKTRPPKEGVPQSTAELVAGEYLVHAHHGIGQYAGLEHLVVDGIGRDFLLLKYLGEDRLYVPVDRMHLVRKYLAPSNAPPRLSRLGGSDWARTRARVREAVEKIAEGLIGLYAEREVASGHAFGPDSPWQAELEESFPYDETPDQRSAIDDVKRDMERPRPTDRLICGDVGYGKTEVAIRAAFKAIMDRKQVAVLCPTTVLAAQHARTFAQRLAAFPVKIGPLSRLRSKAEQQGTLRGLADGSVDLVIGTHRLLQKDVAFARLGLVIVDEEQRFGVMHKERLKELRRTVDVLTLSATPIPRTLHMALAGVRDLSLMQTAPESRLAVKTVVTPAGDAVVARALQQELERGGQVYFVHNRIESIDAVAAGIRRLAPRARIAVSHGRMRPSELENVMLAFVNGDHDILVSTTIIENGLDIPNVNTIIVNNADRFGLAQLYQLRGRVGRSAHQAYAYLLYQPQRVLTGEARARLEAIREFSHLGSGLRLAMRDLEIRGAGNLLGREQSGFIAAVGFDTYCRILAQAVAEKRNPDVAVGLAPTEESPPIIDLRTDAFLPVDYVASANQRIALYQRLAAATSAGAIDAIGEELRDRFGPLPAPASALLEIARLRILATAKGVEKVSLEQRRLTLEVGRRFSVSERAIAQLSTISRGNFRFTPNAIVAHLPADAERGHGLLTTVREMVAAL